MGKQEGQSLSANKERSEFMGGKKKVNQEIKEGQSLLGNKARSVLLGNKGRSVF